MMDKWIGQDEMKEIISFCEILDDLYNKYNEIQNHVSLDIEELFGSTFKVHDSNGDVLGYVGFTDGDGYGLYLPSEDED